MNDARNPPDNPDPFFGRLDEPTAEGTVHGLCGDSMAFYLVIRNARIEDVRYFTRGCGHTRTCGAAVARRALDRTVLDALAISPREILDTQECLPAEGRHCAILAVSTLHRALADHLLTP